jgi:hypothetical protein
MIPQACVFRGRPPSYSCLLRHHDQLLVGAAIAERNRSPDPEALALGAAILSRTRSPNLGLNRLVIGQ